MSDLRRVVTFKPAFDHHGDGRGVCGVILLLGVVGIHGAVDFELLAGWFLPETVKWWETIPTLHGEQHFKPIAGAVNYHRRAPADPESGEVPAKSCTLLEADCFNGGTAYCDGDLIFERLIREGDAGLWAALEERYVNQFGDAK